jgi:membrane-bound lytic murein transglycosylase D
MLRKLLGTALLFIFVTTLSAQQPGFSSGNDARLPYLSPIQLESAQDTFIGDPVVLGEFDRELTTRIARIYRLHVLSLEAQIADDLVGAEKYITDGLTAIQELLDEFPESQSNRRMAELYRTVITEYQEFYGITEPIRSTEGDIFAVLSEVFSMDDMLEDDYFVLPSNIEPRRTEVPLIINQQVKAQINFLAYRRPEVMARWLERSAVYFPMMRQIFQEEGVPQELIHLSMVESGLVPVAQSRARAVGLWQFIYATGAHYGLEVNWWIDERRDPEKATRAAARHLKDLYEVWGDWHLALANYNVSPRRIRSSIQLAGGVRDYWAIYPHLPRETRGYVPIYIAATIISMSPQEFGFNPKFDAAPWAYDVVPVRGSVELSVLAQFAGVTTQELRNLNPELLRTATPPGNAPYPLKIPVGSREVFEAAYRELPETARRQLVVHTVSRGESLGVIANRYSVTVRDIFAANDRLTSTIHPGQEIIIPIPEGSNVAISANNPSRARTASTGSGTAARSTPASSAGSSASGAATPANTTRLLYTVKPGDTVGHVAEWYGTQAYRVRSWNNNSDNIRVGQRLVIFVPTSRVSEFENINSMDNAQKLAMMRNRRSGGGSANVATTVPASSSAETYTVRANDNLWDIARAHNTTVDRIKQLNNMRNDRIFAGQVLRVK